MKNALLLSILMLWSCTKQPPIAGSQASMIPKSAHPTTKIINPTASDHVGIYRIQGKTRTIAYVPTLHYSDYYKKFSDEITWKRYEYSNDWQSLIINTRDDRLRLPSKPDGNIRFEDNYGNRTELGRVGETLRLPDSRCNLIEGQLIYDEDSFDWATPTAGDEIFFLARLKSGINNNSSTMKAAGINAAIGAVFADDKGNVSLMVDLKSTQRYWLDPGSLQGLPVFSKKTGKIIGFIRKNYIKSSFSNGDLDLQITSILSTDLQKATNLSWKMFVSKNKVYNKISVGQEWQKIYCSRPKIDQAISSLITRKGDTNSSLKEPSPPKTSSLEKGSPPWSQGCLTEEIVMRQLKKVIAAQDQAHAAAPGNQETHGNLTPPWDYISSLPTFCSDEVNAALALRISRDKNCQGFIKSDPL